MKRKASIILLAGLTLFSAIAVVSSTLSWFSSSARMEQNPIDGSVQDEYYASGTGTALDPFVITKPRHLYNLAWLQYLGFYNKNSGPDNHQFYFVLGDNVDMSSFSALPPIGTELNPFVGNFDGQGYVVSNLTVSNKFSDFTSHPSSISAWDNNTTHKQPHIVGFFGVIGEYPGGNKNSTYDTSANELINTGLTGLNIKTEVLDSLAGIAVGWACDSNTTDSHTVLKNVVVDNSKITLPASGTTSSYGNDASGNALTNISDYALVGYSNNIADVVKATKTLYGINIDTNKTFNATETGDNEGWGGSIDMKSMYERLYKIANNNTSSYTYTYRTTNTTNPAGTNLAGSPNNVTYTARRYHPNTNVGNFLYLGDRGNFMYMGGGKRVIDNNSKYITHTGYYIKVGTNYLSFNGSAITNVSNDTSTATIWTFEEYSTNVYYIYTDYADSQTSTTSTTRYYLYSNSGNLGITTSKQTTGRWTVSSINDNANMTIVYNNKKIHYYNNEWSLISTTDAAETFNVIQYVDGTSTYYISKNSTSGATPTRTNANDLASAAHLMVESGTNYVYFNNGSTNLYLAMYRSGFTTALRFINGTDQNRYYYFTYSGGTLRANRNGTYYYVSYNNGWTYSTSNTNISLTQKTGDTIQFSTMYLDYTMGSTVSRNGPEYYFDPNDRESYMQYSDEDTTYFPLNVAKDGSDGNVTNGDYAPTDANTGYVIAGSRIEESTTISNGGPSAIRVSKYAKDYTNDNVQRNISNSFKYSNGNYGSGTIADSDVRTITASGDVAVSTVSSTYEKYSDSKDTLLTVLRSDANNYGLHFMNASISKDKLVDASNVSILGTNYTTQKYQLPVNSIDFNLKEKGYINFFAGTYFSSDVDTFFSLHQVFRSAPTNTLVGISNIKEIAAIYGNTSKQNYSYIYQYKGNTATYSKPYRFDGTGAKYELSANDAGTTPYAANYELTDISTYTSTYGYTKLFDTDWITNYNSSGTRIRALNQSYLYYFELPMNDGEFCLGSVEGASGGYLLYLDIGANAAKTNRTILYEKFSLVESSYKYPIGVSLKTLPTTYTQGVATIDVNAVVDDSDSACLVIKATATGEYSIDRNSGDVELSRGQAANAPPVYSGEDIDLIHEKNDDTPINPVAISRTSYDAIRMQYYDYFINTNTLCVTTFTDYTTDGVNYTRTIEQSKYTGTLATGDPLSTFVYDTSKSKDERDSMNVYNTNNGIKYTSADIINRSTVQITESKIPTTEIIEFKIFQDGGSTYDDNTSVVLIVDTSISQTETFYTYNGFAIVLTPDAGTITVKVVDYETGFTLTTYNLTAGTSSSKSVTTVITINGTTVTGEGQVIPEP